MNTFYFFIFVVSLLLAFLFTISIRLLGSSRGGHSSVPSDSNKPATPLCVIGGMGVYVSVTACIGFYLAVNTLLPGLLASPSQSTLLTVLFAGTLIFSFGLYQDLRSPSFLTKLAVQVVAGSILFVGRLRILEFPTFLGGRQLNWAVSLPITVLWVIGITNVFSVIDGLERLATSTSLFSTLVVFCVAIYSHAGLATLVAIALSGAILGFLCSNFNAATVCLGHCGSQFIAFMLSAGSLQGGQKATTLIALAIPLVPRGFTLLKGDPVLHLRNDGTQPLNTGRKILLNLQSAGFHRILIALYAIAAAFAFVELSISSPNRSRLALVLMIVGMGIWLCVQRIRRREVGDVRPDARTTELISLKTAAFRRATDELREAQDYTDICRILESAFSGNEFDAFDLEANLLPSDYERSPSPMFLKSAQTIDFKWSKPSGTDPRRSLSNWSVRLELLTTNNRRRGQIKVYRRYSQRPLLVDMNFLTTIFPAVLADAIDRALSVSDVRSERVGRRNAR